MLAAMFKPQRGVAIVSQDVGYGYISTDLREENRLWAFTILWGLAYLPVR